MVHTYNEESIKTLEGLEAVRKRPGMYVGSTDSQGVRHLFREILANALDEHLAGYGRKIIVQKKGAQIAIRDFGRGIPFGSHPTKKISTLTLVSTQLHAGGKFEDSTGENNPYKVSGGLHGVGLSVVNALSSFMLVQSFRAGESGAQVYREGIPTSEVVVSSSNEENGTLIAYEPDPTIFDEIEVPVESILEDAFYAACLNEIEIELHLDGSSTTLKDLSPASLIQKGPIIHEPVQIPTVTPDQNLFLRFAFSLSSSPSVKCFINAVPVSNGNFLSMFYDCFSDSLTNHGLSFSPAELKESLSLVISVRIPTHMIAFRGQTKDTANIKHSALKPLYDAILNQVFGTRGFKTVLTKFYKPFLTVVQKRRNKDQEIKNALKAMENGKSKVNIILPGKLADCNCEPGLGELYLVEGESAAGSAKQARDRNFQAILPIKGKLLNVLKKGIDDTTKSVTIRDLFQAVGLTIDSKIITITPRYSKIVIATDADVDGAHIRCLILTMMLMWMKPLVENGYIWVARSPLYKIRIKDQTFFAYDDQELKSLNIPKGAQLTRFKGLGELNANDLGRAIFNPETRKLDQITLGNMTTAATVAYTLLGPEADVRLDFLSFFADDLESDRWFNVAI